MPWLIVGDFNSILKAEDRIGYNVVSYGEVVDFKECVEQCDLLEMPKNGSKYTLNDRRDVRINSKIDWVFINRNWLDNMPLYI